MLELEETAVYGRWFKKLRDLQARARVRARVRRLASGHPGDARPVGGGVMEMRIDYGPGYRVYYCRRGRSAVILLAGGDKRSQARDIKRAIKLARDASRDI